MSLTRREIEFHKKRILQGLVDFYYEKGYTQDAYRDEETGGIYEHKLAHTLGYTITADNRAPAEFAIAAQFLEAEGLVRRMVRKSDFPVKGIWPTPAGLDRVDYWRAPWHEKARRWLADQATTIVVAAIVALVTVIISRLFGP